MGGIAGPAIAAEPVSTAFSSAACFVIDRLEGGGSVVTDTGGLTRWGISKRAHPDVDVASLSRSGALAIYHSRYWEAIRGDLLPRGLDLALFDAAVNMGPPTAVKLLQRVLRVKDDGIVGPETLKAIHDFRPASELRAQYNGLRIRTYFDLARSKPIYQQYLFGWVCRMFRLADESGRIGVTV